MIRFSDLYIEMCEKSKEIQDKYMFIPFQKGDYIKHNGSIILITELFNVIHPTIWIPRQDQLQNMLLDKETENTKNKSLLILNGVLIWALEYSYELEDYSLEVLWVLFYMYKKHNKLWNSNIRNWESI